MLEAIAPITTQIAAALGAAHERGIVHRDLKPDNIYLTPDQGSLGGHRVKVLDFGIAKLAGDAEPGVRTKTTSLMGTPAYMSPEQCRGAGGVDHRADVYSLGCIVYEMAVGHRPFPHLTASGELVGAHQYREPEPPRTINPSISVGLEAVIRHMLIKHPDDRYQGMSQIMADLERVVRGEDPALVSRPEIVPPATVPERPAPRSMDRPSEAPPPTTLGQAAAQSVARARPPRSRMALLVSVGAAAIAALTTAIIMLARPNSRESMETPGPASVPTATQPIATPDPMRQQTPDLAKPVDMADRPPATVDAGITASGPPPGGTPAADAPTAPKLGRRTSKPSAAATTEVAAPEPRPAGTIPPATEKPAPEAPKKPPMDDDDRVKRPE